MFLRAFSYCEQYSPEPTKFNIPLKFSFKTSLYIHVQCIQLFWERLSEKMCTPQSWKVIWDKINTLFLMTVAVKPTIQKNVLLLLSFSNHKHTSMASRAILSNFFEEQCAQNYLQYLLGLSHALFLTTFLENSCIKIQLNLHYVTTLTVPAYIRGWPLTRGSPEIS